MWDGISVPELSEYDLRSSRLPLWRRLKSPVTARLYDRPDRMVLRQHLQRNPESYFEHFAGLLRQNGVRLTGDFTPAYSALDIDTLRRIRDGFSARGIQTKAVFLMRDPLDRARSAIRMYHRDGLGAGGSDFQGVNMSADKDAALVDYLSSPQWRIRGDYPSIVRRIEEIFNPDDRYFGFYETLFSEAEFGRLNNFLGTVPDRHFLRRVFNSSGESPALPSDLQAIALETLAPIYDWAFQRWPETRAIWNYSQLERI